MRKFKVGDKVIVTAGKDKGRKGEIVKVWKDDRVTVRGVNIYKKHIKPREGQPGRLVELERPLPTANIALLDKDGKPTRVGFKIIDGKKQRISKRTGEKI